MARKKRQRDMTGITAGFVLSLGFSFLFTVFITGYLGFLMDNKSGERYFTPMGIFLGLIISFHRTYLAFKTLAKDKD